MKTAKRKCLEVIVSGLAAAAVAAGCGKTTIHRKEVYNPSASRKHYSESIGQNSLELPQSKYSSTAKKAEALKDYIYFKVQYSEPVESINRLILSGKHDEVHQSVSNLAGRLERDTNPYSKELLYRIKGMKYYLYEATDIIREEVTSGKRLKQMPDGILDKLVKAGRVLVILGTLPMTKGEGANYLKDEMVESTVKKNEEIERRVFSKIEVQPYSNSRRVIRSGMSYHEVQQDINAMRQ